MNNDVLMEILSRLPVPCLLRFRAVCKFWRDVIDSQFFMNLHTRNNNKLDDTVYLQFNLPLTDDRLLNELSIRIQHNGKALMSYESDQFYDSNLYYACHDDEVRISKPVKGLICIYVNLEHDAPLAICNPFLGQLNILPLATSSCAARRLPWREVAIGFDVDYKVMQLYSCDADSCIHAQMYRRRTNAWEQLADEVISDLRLHCVSPLVSRCKNDHITYWSAHYAHVFGERIILSFDMKNEVFRRIILPELDHVYFNHIFVQDDHSFLNIVVSEVYSTPGDYMAVKIYESRFEGSELSWIYMTRVELISIYRVPLLSPSYVFISDGLCGHIVYDYRARKFIGRQYVEHVFVEYKGSFVSP